MAEFGVQATDLAAPSGGGQVIPPVQEQAVSVNVLPLVDSLVNAWGHVNAANQKKQALDRKNAIIGSYVREETAINDAVTSGQMTAAQAAARSRANANKHSASYPEYIGEFKNAADALKGITERGQVEQQIQDEREIRKKDIVQAQERGYTFYPGMGQEAENAQIRAAKISIQAEANQRTQFAINQEARANGTYNQAVADRQAKNSSMQMINQITEGSMTAFSKLSTDLGEQVRSSNMTPEQAQATLTQHYSKIQGAIQAAAGVDPTLASTYRTLFDDTYKIGLKLIDPKTGAENTQNMLNEMIAKVQLATVSRNPKILGAVVLNKLMPQNASVALATTPEAIEAVAFASQIGAGMNVVAPNIVGVPEVESGTIKILTSALDKLKTKKGDDDEIVKIQASNSVNVMLKQTGEFLDKGLARPENLKDLAGFFASPAYGELVKNGEIDKDAQQAAKKTFQIVYEPAIVKGVNKVLQDSYNVITSVSGGRGLMPKVTSESRPNAPLVSVQYDSSGVKFIPNEGFSGADQSKQKEVLGNLRDATKAVNQLVKLGAHLEGTTDYQKFWEENKHIYLPSMFSKYKNLEIGQIVSNKRYMGGEASDPKNWKDVN